MNSGNVDHQYWLYKSYVFIRFIQHLCCQRRQSRGPNDINQDVELMDSGNVDSPLSLIHIRDECNRASTYNCRSFNFNAARKECFLSSGEVIMNFLKLQIKFDKISTSSFPDDSISLPTGLQQDQDFTFSERAGCNNGETTIGCFSQRWDSTMLFKASPIVVGDIS